MAIRTNILLIFAIASAFGFWFASQQIYMVSPEGFYSYPQQFFVVSVVKCTLTIIAFFLLTQMILSHLTNGKLNSLLISSTYLPLLLVYANCPLLWIVAAILILQCSVLGSVLRRQDYARLGSLYAADLSVFAFLLLLHILFTEQFSPLHWNVAMFTGPGLVSEEIPVVSSLFKGYALAKQFNFSTMDYTEWGGILHPPITLSSPLLQLLTLVFDLPSISPTAFHAIYAAVNFILIVGGAYGFYLFLRYGAKLRVIFACLGGCLFFFSGAPLLALMFNNDGGVFLSSYAVFPYALLFISLAFEKQSYYLAGWAGAASAAQFFLIAPHPEGTIYEIMFYSVFTYGLFLFSPAICMRKKFLLAFTSLMAFFAFSAYDLVPIVYDEIKGYMHTFAHVGDIAVNRYDILMPYLHLLTIFMSILLLLAFIQKKLSSVYSSSIFLAFCILAFFTMTTNGHTLVKMFHSLHITLHVWFAWRLGMYFCLSVIIIAMMAVDEVTSVCLLLISKKYPALFGKLVL